MPLAIQYLKYTEITLARAAAPLGVKRQPETFTDKILRESFKPVHKASVI